MIRRPGTTAVAAFQRLASMWETPMEIWSHSQIPCVFSPSSMSGSCNVKVTFLSHKPTSTTITMIQPHIRFYPMRGFMSTATTNDREIKNETNGPGVKQIQTQMDTEDVNDEDEPSNDDTEFEIKNETAEPPVRQVQMDPEVPEQQDDSKKYEQRAFDYFNDIKFFEDQIDKEFYIRKGVRGELNKTVDDFYRTAWNNHKTDETDLKLFFLTSIVLCKDDVVLEDFKQWKVYKNIRDEADITPRMVSVGYQVGSTQINHQFDLQCFSEKINEMFTWWDTNFQYVGPYFCFIQSSGMGKTKLMYEYKAYAESGVKPLLILPGLSTLGSSNEEEKNVFDNILELEGILNKNKNLTDAVNDVNDKLDNLLRTVNTNCTKIVLMFDESQVLLKEHKEIKAFLFRCIRVWLREKRDQKVVAVFAGTNSRLTNFIVDSDRDYKVEQGIPSSRGMEREGKTYHDKGPKLYGPFYQTTTMDAIVPESGNHLSRHSIKSEYDRAIYYGRPLFAILAKEGILESKMPVVFARMVLGKKNVQNWYNMSPVHINILGTRVQLGQTSVALTSEFVAWGYANLVGFNPESEDAKLAYIPDPVCARIAMCMMDEDFVFNLKTISTGPPVRGMSKKMWSVKLKEIFSSGVVSPHRGDFGEVVGGLYMLFCGDVLRKTIQDNRAYTHFSVSLDEWLYTLNVGGEKPAEGGTMESSSSTNQVSLSFIQVCRNDLRNYAYMLKKPESKPKKHRAEEERAEEVQAKAPLELSSLYSKTFLKNLYEAGTAFYTYRGCTMIDLVAPLRVGTGDDASYVPMMVSIKCKSDWNPSNRKTNCEDMEKQFKNMESRLGRGAAAFGLVICFGLSETPDMSSIPERFTRIEFGEVSSSLLSGSSVTKIICVPNDDEFGLTEALNAMTSVAQEKTELVSSHSFLKAYGDEEWTETEYKKVLRSTSRKPMKVFLRSLRGALTGQSPLMTKGISPSSKSSGSSTSSSSQKRSRKPTKSPKTHT